MNWLVYVVLILLMIDVVEDAAKSSERRKLEMTCLNPINHPKAKMAWSSERGCYFVKLRAMEKVE